MFVCIITFHLLLPFHAYIPTAYAVVQSFADMIYRTLMRGMNQRENILQLDWP
uniref:Uncharacterized protein n=1 Tax=Arundo donax TaxID=35708 RepID=A0A0A9GMS5_ARUDO